MDLSAEQFIQVVTAIAAGSKEGQPDQRRQARASLRARATIIPLAACSDPTALAIQVRDLSPAGIGFLHEQKMSLDEQFALVLPRTGDTPAVVLCAVAFWQPLARDLYAIGARFKRILRDGGDPALPIQLDTSSADLATQIESLHRQAG